MTPRTGTPGTNAEDSTIAAASGGKAPDADQVPTVPARPEPMLLYLVKQVELAVRARLDDMLPAR